MNLTLCSIHISSLLSSPMFTLQSNSLSIKSSCFSKFLSHTIYFNENMQKLYLKSSFFQEFVINPIQIDYKGIYSLTPRERFLVPCRPSKIVNCVFKNIFSQRKDGGSIYSNTDIYIQNCFFENSTGSRGGAIFSNGSVIMNFVTILTCNANRAGGAYFINTKSVDINSTLFLKLTAGVHGSTLFKKIGKAAIFNSNFSGSLSFDRSGIGEFKNTANANLMYNEFSNATTVLQNSGISFYGNTEFNIESCHFDFIQCVDEIAPSSEAIWIDGSTVLGSIIGCDFNDTGFIFAGYSIYFNTNSTDDIKVSIINCYFTYPAERSFNFFTNAHQQNFLENNYFNSTKFIVSLQSIQGYSHVSYLYTQKNYVFGFILFIFILLIILLIQRFIPKTRLRIRRRLYPIGNTRKISI